MTHREIAIYYPRRSRRGFQFGISENGQVGDRKIDLNEPPCEATNLDLLDEAGNKGWELVVITEPT